MKALLLTMLLVVPLSSMAKDYTLVADPKGTLEEEKAIYDPLAEYLSRETGDKFTYVYIRDWISYRKAVSSNTHDIYFDGSHLASWKVEFRKHRYLARLNEWLSFVVIRRTDNKLGPMRNLAGKQVCLHPEPNQATLMFFSMFDNPSRQPATKVIQGWRAAYDGVVNGECVAAVIPYELFEKFNVDKKTVMMEQFDLTPNQTFTASPRIPDATVDKIKAALMKNEHPAVKRLLGAYSSRGLIPVNEVDYRHTFLILYTDTVLGDDIARERPFVAGGGKDGKRFR